MLLDANAGENRIISTLALANHLCHGVPRLVAEGVLSLRPSLADYPERVAALLGIEEHDVLAAYEALEVEGELLP